MLMVALLLAGAGVIGFVIWNETAGKARRRRKLERNHSRSKVRDTAN
ncbi:MAG: hypothetical protein JSS55_05640 [Proteobacteria bacterium]|nr:hypothetical protein [Pseudomonadota bacterium]